MPAWVHRSWSTEQGLPQSSVASALEALDGHVWIGTFGGLARFDGLSFPVFDTTNTPELKSNCIRALYEDSDANLWIGTEHGGLARYRNGIFQSFLAAQGLVGNVVVSLAGYGTSGLVAGTTDRAALFDGHHFVRLETEPPIPHDTVYSMCRTRSGDLWQGTQESGLIQIHGSKPQRYESTSTVSLQSIWALAEDSAGDLWICDNAGLLRLHSSTFTRIRPAGASLLGSVLALYFDRAGSLWAGASAAIKASDGSLWFSVIKSVAAICPSQLRRSAPPIVVQEVTLDGKPVVLNMPLRLPPDAGSLKIKYAALTFVRPEHVQFKHRLSGLNRSWVKAANRRTVVYQNLPPGAYTFQVIADDGFGAWNNHSTALHFMVVPPFWRTTWFGGLASLPIAATTVLLHFPRLAWLQRAHAVQQNFSRLLIESQESERQRIAAKLHDGLGQSLLIIKNRALLALQSLGDQESAGEQLEEISSTASNAVEEARVIAYDLHPYQLNRFGLTKSILGIARKPLKVRGLSF